MKVKIFKKKQIYMMMIIFQLKPQLKVMIDGMKLMKMKE